MRVWFDVKQLREFQRANERMIHAVRPRGALGRSVKQSTEMGYRILRTKIHRDTSAAQAAIRMRFRETKNTATGEVYFDPNAKNPRAGKGKRGRRKYRRVVDYIGYEFARGGSHDAWSQMLHEVEPNAVRGAEIVLEDLKRA